MVFSAEDKNQDLGSLGGNFHEDRILPIHNSQLPQIGIHGTTIA